jgi:hypothetical protein
MGRIIASPSDLIQLMTTKPQQIILIILFFKMVISNMKAKLNILKLGTSAEKMGLLIKSKGFEKRHKPVSSYMLGGTQNAPLKVGT